MSKTINPDKMSAFDRQYLESREIDPDEYAATWQLDEDGKLVAREAAPDEQESESDEDAPYSEWTNEELRAELKRRELSAEGKKAELIERLEADDAEQGDDTEA